MPRRARRVRTIVPFSNRKEIPRYANHCNSPATSLYRILVPLCTRRAARFHSVLFPRRDAAVHPSNRDNCVSVRALQLQHKYSEIHDGVVARCLCYCRNARLLCSIPSKVVLCVEARIPKELKAAAMQLVGAGLGYHEDLPSTEIPILGVEVAREHSKLSNRIEVWNYARRIIEVLLN